MWVFCVVSLKLFTVEDTNEPCRIVDVCVGCDVYEPADNFVAADVVVDADLGSMGQNAHQRDESMALNKLPAKSC